MSGTSVAPGRAAASPGDETGAPATPIGLLMDLAAMVSRLRRELQRGPTLDAYLLSVGLGQIADDYLHAVPHSIDRAARYLAKRSGPASRVAAATASGAVGAVRTVRSRRVATPVLDWRRHLGELVDILAMAQICRPDPAVRRSDLDRRLDTLAGAVERLPLELREAVVRLPACFHQFDQRPADVVSLTQRFAARAQPGNRPLLVVGVRTSGSYLAPLCAATLKALGYRRVRTLSVRPEHPLLGYERRLVGSTGGDRGLCLLLDDPPVTGSSLLTAVAHLEHAGLPSESVTLLLQLFGESMPAALRHLDAVLLPLSDWSVERDLDPDAVRDTLSRLFGEEVLAIERLPLPAGQPERGHARRLFRVRTADAPGARDVLIEGVGLGYLGAHRLAARTLVERFSPTVLGLRDGLLYREWLPPERRVRALTSRDEDALAAAVAEYAAQRRRSLPLDADLSLRMAGEDPAWEVTAKLLSQAFGRAWPVAQVLLTSRATRRVLRVRRPSVVDGNTDLAQWFWRNGSRPSVVKPDVGEDRFANLAPVCFDAAFDLAGVTALAGTPSLPSKLRRAFAEVGGEDVDEERWLLYELAHLRGRERTQPGKRAQVRRARARALQRYFADVYLRDVPRDPAGPLCALDIDGVLETDQFGAPGLTPAAALALRSLLVHGYQPVLASGRSLDEVSERCRVYGLAGGVAEYGTVIFHSASGRAEALLPDGSRLALERLRAALCGVDGVHLDPDYRFAVRAFTLERGRRRALPSRVSAKALARVEGAGIQTIVGEGQTDFVAPAVSKGAGLRALAAALGADGRERPFVLAVGDSAPDLAFAGMAARLCAPRHADQALRRAGFGIMARPYQAGLAQAVGRLLDHSPGGCPVCRMSDASRERAIVRTLLGVQERGRLGMALRALELGWRVR